MSGQETDDLKDRTASTVIDHLVILDVETGEVLVSQNGTQTQAGGLETGSPA